MTVRELFTYRVFTVSNFLSLSRVLLLPLLWLTLQKGSDEPTWNYYSIAILCLMILTDFFDGLIARLLGQESPLGQYLDPVADKLAILGGLIMLVIHRAYPVWVVVFIFLREAAGTFIGGYLLIKKNILGKPNWWGKFGVGFCALSGLAYLVEWQYKEYTIWLLVFTFLGGIAAYAKTYWRTVFG